jgi:hypothetical protein
MLPKGADIKDVSEEISDISNQLNRMEEAQQQHYNGLEVLMVP